MSLVRSLYAKLREAFPANRVVALSAGPAAALSGYIAVWVAENFPGVSVPEGALTAVFITGATAVVVTAYKWLDGWARYESDPVAQGLEIDRLNSLRK